MISIRTLSTIALSAPLLFLLTSCNQQQEEASIESTAAAAPTQTTSVQAPAMGMGMAPPADGRPRLSPEERAAAAALAAEKSAAATFNTTPLIDPNTATLEELSAIAGLSDAGVQAIMAARPFATPSEMHAAISAGMSEEELYSVYSAAFIKVNLNTSSNDDFRLVPTTLAPRKLAHEFEEYRPYKTMEDFSREMSKYVSEKEVAFLQRFVTID